MNNKTIINLIKQNADILKYPYTIYKNNKLLDTNIDFNFTDNYLDIINNSNKDISFIFTKESLCFIYTKILDYLIIIGPSIFSNISKKLSNTINEIYHYDIDYNEYLISITNHSFNELLNIACNINGLINHKYINTSSLIKNNYIFEELINLEKDKLEGIKYRQNNYEYEDRLLKYVSKGMVKEIENYPRFKGNVPELGKDSIRHYKNSLIILNSLCIREVIKAGVDQDVSYQVGEIYLNRIEECKSIDDILMLNKNNEIPIRYALLVNNIKNDFKGSNSIKKIIEYIRSNYQERITVKDLANKFNYSSEYLSSLFHKEVGITIPEYVTNLKIERAKILLKYTNLSLIDISTLLSFSSQQYFQTVFKRIVKQTPNYYRNYSK